MKKILMSIFAIVMLLGCVVGVPSLLMSCAKPADSQPADEEVSSKASGYWDNSSYRDSSFKNILVENGELTVYISSAAQLGYFVHCVNSELTYNSLYYYDANVKIVADIDLSAHYWIPIGRDNSFTGTIDGNYHTIRGLTIWHQSTSYGYYKQITGPFMNGGFCLAFIGHAAGATIQNLLFEDVNIYTNNIDVGENDVAMAVLIGEANGSNTITNVGVVSGELAMNYTASAGEIYFGGLIGFSFNSTVSGCFFLANMGNQNTMQNDEGFATHYAGGIVGVDLYGSDGYIENSYFYGDLNIYGFGMVGGIIGCNTGQVYGCYFEIDRRSALLGGRAGGGIAGYNRGIIFSCFTGTYSYVHQAENSNVESVQLGQLVGYNSGQIYKCTYDLYYEENFDKIAPVGESSTSEPCLYFGYDRFELIVYDSASEFYKGDYLYYSGSDFDNFVWDIPEEVSMTVDTSYVWTRITNRQEQYPILTWYASLGRSEILHYLSNGGDISPTPNKKLYIQNEWVKYSLASSIEHFYDVTTDEHTVVITPADGYETIGVPVYIPDFNKSYKISFTYTSTTAEGSLRFRIYTTPPNNGWYNGESEQIYGYTNLTGSQTNASVSYSLSSSTLLGKASYITNNTIYICFNGGALTDGQGAITYTIKNFKVELNDGLNTTQVVQVGNPYAEISTPTKTGYTFSGWNQNIYTLDDVSVSESTGDGAATLRDGLFSFEIDNSSGQTSEYGYFYNNDTSIGINSTHQYTYVLNVESYSGTSSLIYLAYSQDSVMYADGITVASAGLYTSDATYNDGAQEFTYFGSGRFNIAVGETVSTKFRVGLFDITSPSAPTITTLVPDRNNLLLYGEFTPNDGIVTFNSYGGTFSTTQPTGLTYVTSTSVTKSVTYDSAIGTLPTLNTRSGYTFDGWYTSTDYTTQVTESTILSSTSAVYYAKWAPIPITHYISVAFCDNVASNVFTVTSDWKGVSCSVSYLSGTTMSGGSAATSSTACTGDVSISVLKGAKKTFSDIVTLDGYACVGVYSNSSSLTSISYSSTYAGSSAIESCSTSYFYSTRFNYLLFKRISDNRIKYDKIDQYFYFEDGLFPQTAVITYDTSLNSTLSDQSGYTTIAMKDLTVTGDGDDVVNTYNISAGTTFDESKYTLPKDGSVLRLLEYDGKRYAGVMLDSAKALQLKSSTGTLTSYTFSANTIYWFKFDPIRWRVSDYGVSDYPSDFAYYGNGIANSIVASDVLWYGSLDFDNNLTAGSSAKELDMVTLLDNFNSSFFGDSDASMEYSTSSVSFGYDSYGTASTGNIKVNKDLDFKETDLLQIASESDVLENSDSLKSYASHLVCVLMGIDQDEYAEYWTRDLGQTIGNGTYVSKSGEIITSSNYTKNNKGIRFSMCLSEGSRAFDASVSAVKFEGTTQNSDGAHIYSSYNAEFNTYAISTGPVNWNYDVFTSHRIEVKKGTTYTITYDWVLVRTADVDSFGCAVGLAHYTSNGTLIVDCLIENGAGEFTATVDATYFIFIDGSPYAEFNISNVSITKS